MLWLADLLAAKAARLGVRPFLFHPMDAPFVGGLADGRPKDCWQIENVGNGWRYACNATQSPKPRPASGTLTLSTATPKRAREALPDFLLAPKAPAGFRCLLAGFHAIPSAAATPEGQALATLAEGFTSGAVDPFDWAKAELQGQTALRDIHWVSGTDVGFALDPLAMMVSVSDPVIVRGLGQGKLVVRHGEPVALHLPKLGGQSCHAVLHTSGTAMDVLPGAGVSLRVLREEDRLVLDASGPGASLPILLRGRGAELRGVQVRVNRAVPADQLVPQDSLAEYGDPLSGYADIERR